MQDLKKVIVDVDLGVDDYMALLLLFFAHKTNKIKIEAIFCTNGNTKVDNVCKNVVRLLETIEQRNISVYKGVPEPFVIPDEPLPNYYGKDGFGDLTYGTEPDLSIIQNFSSIALREIVISNRKEISLICLGPLTNLALSLKLFEDVGDNLKDIWIMGGNYVGNGAPPSSDYNFFIDPEAAHIVLESAKSPVYIIPKETCAIPNITYDWFYSNMEGGKSPAVDLLVRAERSTSGNETKYKPSDAFAAFAFLDPQNNILKTSLHYGSVNLENPHRGEIILNDTKVPNIIIVEKIDEDLFKEDALNVVKV